jgi:cytochrome c biogenesis protein CcdA
MLRRELLTTVFSLLLIVLVVSSVGVYGEGNFLLYIYGSEGCPHCRALKDYFTSWYGSSNTYFCSLDSNASCVERFLNFYHSLNMSASIPLTFVVVNGSVRAVVIGEVSSRSFWDSLLSLNESNTIPLYISSNLLGYLVVDDVGRFTRVMVPEYFTVIGNASTTGGGSSSLVTTLPITYALSLLVPLALSDAVNPCVLFIYTLLLIATSIAFSRRRNVLLVGTSFISAVFVGYYLLGLGLISVVRGLPKEFLSLVAIGFGLWVSISGVMGRSRVLGRESVLNLISKASTSASLTFALGLLLTFTLLPCSAGPYVVFVGIASKYSPPLPYLLLTLYNVLFISPLIAILVIITTTMRYKSVQEFLLRNNNTLSLIAGLLLMAVGVWLLMSM